MSSHEEEIDEVSGSEGQPEEVVKEDAEVEEEEAPLEQPKETFELTRSEKKRDREKKRRKDLNAGYDALMSLIFKIDPKIRQEAEERVKKSKGGVEELPVLNRLELIQSTVHVLERVHQENEERKLVIIHLSRGLLGGGEGGGALPPELPSLSAALRQNPGHSFPNQRDFQQVCIPTVLPVSGVKVPFLSSYHPYHVSLSSYVSEARSSETRASTAARVRSFDCFISWSWSWNAVSWQRPR